MFHIPDDKRSRRSAFLLYQSLIAIGKAPGEVTVTELSEKAGVGRATFYRLFDNASDILRWKCWEIMEEALEKAGEDEGFDRIFLSFIESWTEEPELMRLLLRSSMTDILQEVHLSHFERIREVFFKGKGLSEEVEQYLVVLLSSMMAGAFKLYQERSLPEAGEILSLFRKALGAFSSIFGGLSS